MNLPILRVFDLCVCGLRLVLMVSRSGRKPLLSLTLWRAPRRSPWLMLWKREAEAGQ